MDVLTTPVSTPDHMQIQTSSVWQWVPSAMYASDGQYCETPSQYSPRSHALSTTSRHNVAIGFTFTYIHKRAPTLEACMEAGTNVTGDPQCWQLVMGNLHRQSKPQTCGHQLSCSTPGEWTLHAWSVFHLYIHIACCALCRIIDIWVKMRN